MWRQNRNNTQAIHSIRLRLVIEGVGEGVGSTTSLQSPINSIRTPGMLDNNTINRFAANLYQTTSGNTVNEDAGPTDDGARLDALRQEEVFPLSILG